MEANKLKKITKLIFILNGYPRSGKDTFAEFLKEYQTPETIKYHFQNISTVDYIKSIAENFFGWDQKKDEKGRRLLSDLKDASRRYNNGPFHQTVSQIGRYEYYNFYINENVLENDILFLNIIHTREPDEIQMFKEHYKDLCSTILIKRNYNGVISNHADKNVENYKYDYIIENNNSLKDFKKQTHTLFEQILKDKNITF